MKKRTIALVLILTTFVCIFAFAACDKTGNGKDLPSGETPSGSIQSGDNSDGNDLPSGGNTTGDPSGSNQGGSSGNNSDPSGNEEEKIDYSKAFVTEDNGATITSVTEYGKTLSKLVIPDTITSIDEGAFSGCSNLESITLPFVGASADETEALSSTLFGYIFGESSYAGGTATEQKYAYDKSTTYYIPTSLRSVTITGGKNIYFGAFFNCRSLTSVTFGENSKLESIGYGAFYNCSSVTSIEIPSSVTSIGGEAFYNCSSLTSIKIPSSVMGISNYAFRDCTSLTIYSEESSKPSGWDSYWNFSRPVVWNCKNNEVADDGYIYFLAESGIKYGVKDGKSKVAGHSALSGDIVIPSSVTYNGNSYSVTSIGYNAFYKCSSLTSIEIPSSVTSIGSEAFKYCSALTSIEIPSSVTSIGSYAFRNCSSLTSIEIPSSVTSISECAFQYCSSLTIYCEAPSKPSGWVSYWNYSDCPVVWDYKNN